MNADDAIYRARLDLLAEAEIRETHRHLAQGRCPACGRDDADVTQRAGDGMFVCAACEPWAYRDFVTGTLAYPKGG